MEVDIDSDSLLGRAMDLREVGGLGIDHSQLRLLCRSAKTNNIHFLRSHLAKDIGYIAYAMVNVESIREMSKTARYPFCWYEWDEGIFFLICDVFILPKWRRQGFRRLKEFCSQFRAITYLRRGRLKLGIRRGNRRKFIFLPINPSAERV